jgi:hypothetical protein
MNLYMPAGQSPSMHCKRLTLCCPLPPLVPQMQVLCLPLSPLQPHAKLLSSGQQGGKPLKHTIVVNVAI